ncbi:MAG: ABC transporter ATP-binding protein [Comamonadaceae bacterium]|nr:MAG: ABC transporter ATP-binding protein [Comamonadaceae bacterium]
MLKVREIRKSFGGLQALKGVSFDIPDRSILGVIGMNGSGKTTLLNCINGIYQADGGSVELDGQAITHQTPRQAAERGLGRTFQVPRLFPRLTLDENLEIPLIPRGVSPKESRARADHWLDKVLLSRLRRNYASELSGGQQKLLELARIMVTQPKLILLDEPFAGVNPELALRLIEIIRRIPTENGCSVMLVSHDLTSIYQLSDHIVVLNEGAIISEGGVDQVKGDPAVIEAYLGAD